MTNKTYLIGRIGSISEPVDANGSTVVNVRLVTVEHYKEEHEEWHDLAGWGPIGENMAKVLTPGDLVHVEGPLRTTKTKKNGTTYTNTHIRVSDWQLLARPKKGDGQAAAAAETDEETATG